MILKKFSLLFVVFLFSVSATFAQGVFEGSGEVSDPNCVGDGCGFVSAEQAADNAQNFEYGDSQNSGETEADSVAQESDSLSTADSLKVATTNIDEEDEDRPNYINETAAEYRARKEGFSKSMQFGVRLAAGFNKSFGNKSDLWNVGFDGGAGLMARLLLGRSLGIATELDFTYRHYSCETQIAYATGHHSNFEATIDEKLFEIPVMAQYIFSEDGLFIGAGVNLGLKMQADSEVKQVTEKEGERLKEKRPNTIPASGVEIGALLDIGYMLNRWLMADLRVVQNFTNLIDMNLLGEPTLKKSKLFTSHVALGVTLLL